MAASYILAHDLGTTGDKAALFDRDGKPVASAFSAYQTTYPEPGWAEQNPTDWWSAVCLTTRNLLVKSNIGASDLACIVFSGQMMGCVPIDRQTRPLRNAIIWADTRAMDEERTIIERAGMHETYKITGHRASASYSGAKIMWIRNHHPEVFRQVYKFMHAKDFIAARMTGNFATDYSDASGMNLFNLKTQSWSPTMLDAMQLDPVLLPDAHPSTDVIGNLLPQAASELGLQPGIPVVIGGGDGSCAATGAGVVAEGSAYLYIGSSAWIGITTNEPIFDSELRTFTWAHLVPGKFSPTGTMQAAGASYQWLRDTVCLTEKQRGELQGTSAYEEMNALAEKSPPGAKGLYYFPYLLGERSPRWNPQARGAFFGLSISHDRSDMNRATLEGITLNLRVILDAFRQQGAQISEMRVIGGGANGRIWRKILADIFGIPIQRPALLAEATSFGAALAGGIGVGLYKDFSLAELHTPVMDTIEPDQTVQPLYDRMYEVFNRSYQAFEPLYPLLLGNPKK